MSQVRQSSLLESFQEHYDDLMRFLIRRMGDVARAADAAQETYVRLARIPGPDEDVKDPRAFVFRVAGNIAIDTLRRDGRISRVEAVETDISGVADMAPSAEALVLSRERLRLLDGALGQLPGNVRLALLYNRVDGFTQAEIAVRLGVSESMVAKYIGQALRHCRKKMRLHGATEL